MNPIPLSPGAVPTDTADAVAPVCRAAAAETARGMLRVLTLMAGVMVSGLMVSGLLFPHTVAQAQPLTVQPLSFVPQANAPQGFVPHAALPARQYDRETGRDSGLQRRAPTGVPAFGNGTMAQPLDPSRQPAPGGIPPAGAPPQATGLAERGEFQAPRPRTRVLINPLDSRVPGTYDGMPMEDEGVLTPEDIHDEDWYLFQVD